MAVRSVSFDDDSDEELSVFSGNDLLIAHYDVADLDWQEVAERSALDERRGLVITQVAVLEDLIDEFILYLADPVDTDDHQSELDTLTIGPRLKLLEGLLSGAGLLDDNAVAVLGAARQVVARRNELAHGTIHWRPVEPVKPGSWLDEMELEWVITSRHSRTFKRITMAGLRQDLHEAISCFSSMLQYAEWFVETAPPPRNFSGGQYLGTSSR
jgi:hypothetical protein